MGVRRNFSRGGNVNILLILVRLLMMQCKCTFTKRLTFCTRVKHKKMPHVTATVTKMRLFGRHSQVYYDNFHNTLSAGFQNRVLLFTSVAITITKTAKQNARENLPSSTTTIATSKPLGDFPQKAITKPLEKRFPNFF